MERKKRDTTDILLSPELHPVGTRLILTDVTWPNNVLPYEATILEWSPDSYVVKLDIKANSDGVWYICRDYKPVVVSVLSPLEDTIVTSSGLPQYDTANISEADTIVTIGVLGATLKLSELNAACAANLTGIRLTAVEKHILAIKKILTDQGLNFDSYLKSV